MGRRVILIAHLKQHIDCISPNENTIRIVMILSCIKLSTVTIGVPSASELLCDTPNKDCTNFP